MPEICTVNAYTHWLRFFRMTIIFFKLLVGHCTVTQDTNIMPWKSDPFIFHIEADFSELSHCEQRHQLIMSRTSDMSILYNNNDINNDWISITRQYNNIYVLPSPVCLYWCFVQLLLGRQIHIPVFLSQIQVAAEWFWSEIFATIRILVLCIRYTLGVWRPYLSVVS